MSVLLISVQRNLDIMGLKSLHHFLLDKGHDSTLLYLPQIECSDARERDALTTFVAERAPSLIGVSLMANDYEYAEAVTRCLKDMFPEVPIVWGGIHATTAPKECLETADYVCLGEGEQALLDIVEARKSGHPLESINNLGYLCDGAMVQNPLYPLVEDLDALPAPRQIPEQSYVQLGDRVLPLETRHLEQFKRYKGRVYKVLTSRGCPYGCTYCCNNFLRKLYGHWGVRRRSPEHVMAELELALKEGPRVEYVDFIDDCFLACTKDYLEEFCRQYRERIGRPFIAKGTARYFTREKLDLAVAGGMAWANMGLQSGCDQVCSEVYGRGVRSKDFLAAANLIHEYPVGAYYDLIVDNPFETEEQTLETVETLMQVPKPFHILIFSLSFYHGTSLRERALQEAPESVEDPTAKDYLVRNAHPVNSLVEMAPYLHGPLMRWLVGRYRKAPKSAATRMAITLAGVYCRVLLSPIAYLRLIRRTQKGSLVGTLRVLPMYFHGAFKYYRNYFGIFKRAVSSE